MIYGTLKLCIYKGTDMRVRGRAGRDEGAGQRWFLCKSCEALLKDLHVAHGILFPIENEK